MASQIEGQMSLFDLGIWSGKMCPEPSTQTKEKILGVSSKKPRESSVKMPLFLNLQRGSGLIAGVFWETDGVSLGEFTMRSFGEYPSAVRESRLSQILEDRPHPKYSLSAKACQGILSRAKRRGKTLPKQLEEALITQSVSKNAPDVQGGKGILIQHGRTGALSTLGNQSVFKFPDSEENNSTICIEGNGARGSHKGNGYKESDTMYTLNTVEQHAVVSYKKDEPQKQTPETMCVVQDAYDKLTESQISASIKASGGNYGGSEALVIQ